MFFGTFLELFVLTILAAKFIGGQIFVGVKIFVSQNFWEVKIIGGSKFLV